MLTIGQDPNIRSMVESFLANLQPGAKLELPGIGWLEYQPGRRLCYFNYRTGLLRVWTLPDPNEESIVSLIESHLAELFMKK
jgi:hypothetical protein